MTTVYDTDPTTATTMPLHTPSMTTVHTPAADNIIGMHKLLIVLESFTHT